VDPACEKALEWTPYRYGFDNPVKYVDAQGKFELSQDLINKYPRLASYLKNDIQGILSNKTIMVGLMYYGQMSQEKINSDVQWNKGPKINISSENYSGKKYTEKNYGSYSKNAPNTLSINEHWAKKLESAKGEEKDALLFLLAVTILHEYVHYGDYTTDKIEEYYEVGEGFENYVYGESITIDNADDHISGKEKNKSQNSGKNSGSQQGRLNEGDPGYIGSYWDAFDAAKNF
jgi:hypothetical protein